MYTDAGVQTTISRIIRVDTEEAKTQEINAWMARGYCITKVNPLTKGCLGLKHVEKITMVEERISHPIYRVMITYEEPAQATLYRLAENTFYLLSSACQCRQ